LSVFPSDDRGFTDLEKLPKSDRVTYDIKNNLVMFNGNSAHEVNDYSGNRYSIVYFTIGCHAKMTDECREGLAKIGMPVPAPDEDSRALLGAPPGYNKRKAETSTKPTLRCWAMKDINCKPGRSSLKKDLHKVTKTMLKKKPAGK